MSQCKHSRCRYAAKPHSDFCGRHGAKTETRGRPRKPAESLRSKLIQVKLTRLEHARVVASAAKAELTITDFVRLRCL
jgi:hypothetical protein